MSKIFIISGPSGCGKGTIIDKLLQNQELNLYWAKSYTTRPIRESDRKENKYLFTTVKEFKEIERRGEILESNLYNGNWYGTSRMEIQNALKKGVNVIKDIDVHGAMAYTKMFQNLVLIFIKSDLVDIETRLQNRQQNSEEEIQNRLAEAIKEMEFAKHYDYVVENKQNHLDEAITEISNIIKKENNERN